MNKNKDFPCLEVELLFSETYYDGPLSGVCQYNGEKLFFWLMDEHLFKYAEKDPELLKSDDLDDKYTFHRLRIYSLFKIPKEYIDILEFNHKLFEKLKHEVNCFELYNFKKKTLPDYFEDYEKWEKVAWQWACGYTTEDAWQSKKYLKEKLNT